MKKNRKKLMICFFALAVVFMAAFILIGLIGKEEGPQKTLSKVARAMEKNNIKEYMKYVYMGDEESSLYSYFMEDTFYDDEYKPDSVQIIVQECNYDEDDSASAEVIAAVIQKKDGTYSTYFTTFDMICVNKTWYLDEY